MSAFIKRGWFAVIALTVLQLTANAAEISLHDVYEAAQSGRLREAQTMMQQVLRDHPNSAKAHYVEAEILAKAGQLAQARNELATAERLEPGLTFASPSALQSLHERLNGSAPVRHQAQASFPWGLALLGIALIMAAIMFIRAIRQRTLQSAALQSPLQNPSAFGPNGPGYGPGYGPGVGPMSGGGLGSGIMGGLATGAALGAGMVAGEALAHRMMGDGQSSGVVPDAHAENLVERNDWDPNANMGGNDFGVNDAASWDDNSASSSSWDSGGGGDFGGGDWS